MRTVLSHFRPAVPVLNQGALSGGRDRSPDRSMRFSASPSMNLAYPVSDITLGQHSRYRSDLNELEAIRQLVLKRCTWLKPGEVQFKVVDTSDFYGIAARDAMPARYAHAGFGKKLQDLYGAPVYDVLADGNPTYAFLMQSFPQTLKMALIVRALAQSDFLHHNRHRVSPERNIQEWSGLHRQTIEQYKKQVGEDTVRSFLNQTEALKWLIDFTAAKPLEANEQAVNPSKDVLAYLIQHAPNLAVWQKDILQMLREESYYLASAYKTRFMRDGWASFWQDRLQQEIPILQAKMMDTESFLALQPPSALETSLSRIAYQMWKVLAETTPQSKLAFNKLKPLRDQETDVGFVEQYLTPAVYESIVPYLQQGPYSEAVYTDAALQAAAEAQRFTAFKQRLLEMLASRSHVESGGYPQLEILNDDFRHQGELLIRHDYQSDLDIEQSKAALRVLGALWTRPVHLLSRRREWENQFPLLYSYFPDATTVNRMLPDNHVVVAKVDPSEGMLYLYDQQNQNFVRYRSLADFEAERPDLKGLYTAPSLQAVASNRRSNRVPLKFGALWKDPDWQAYSQLQSVVDKLWDGQAQMLPDGTVVVNRQGRNALDFPRLKHMRPEESTSQGKPDSLSEKARQLSKQAQKLAEKAQKQGKQSLSQTAQKLSERAQSLSQQASGKDQNRQALAKEYNQLATDYRKISRDAQEQSQEQGQQQKSSDKSDGQPGQEGKAKMNGAGLEGGSQGTQGKGKPGGMELSDQANALAEMANDIAQDADANSEMGDGSGRLTTTKEASFEDRESQSEGHRGDGATSIAVPYGYQPYLPRYSPEQMARLFKQYFKLPNLEPLGGDLTETSLVPDRTVSRPPGEINRSATLKRAIQRTVGLAASQQASATMAGLSTRQLKIRQSDSRHISLDEQDERVAKAAIIFIGDFSNSNAAAQAQLTKLGTNILESQIRHHYQQQQPAFSEKRRRTGQRKQEGVETVFIVQSALAMEVDRETFFNIKPSGGTRFAHPYEVAGEIIEERYPPQAGWQTYIFHFTDGKADLQVDAPGAVRGMKALVETGAVKRIVMYDLRDLEDLRPQEQGLDRGIFRVIREQFGEADPSVRLCQLPYPWEVDERGVRILGQPLAQGLMSDEAVRKSRKSKQG